jgi:hypothetical protein
VEAPAVAGEAAEAEAGKYGMNWFLFSSTITPHDVRTSLSDLGRDHAMFITGKAWA